MPLNKLENFIKNYEGRILYVNSNDLDATDSITNQGNSLTKPFKSIQRALLEAARFSFVPGENNDRNDRTTILVYPGEHLIDNRPGYGIRKVSTALAEAVSPSGQVAVPASDVFNLNLQTNFDLTQEDNVLYKFNSINGGVILPRGTSLIGLDLRKTKIRPKYVPNPTDDNVPSSSFFKITGNCFFWNFSLFDADPNQLVYTDNSIFELGSGNQATPTFSHHKLTVFEYVDGVNVPSNYELSDLDMYYAKLSNAFNEGSTRQVPSAQKFPLLPEGFAKERSEWEIVGAFGTDPVQITSIYSGDGATPNSVVTVTTQIPHNLTVDTPIKIRGVNVSDYNVSTVVQSVPTPTTFTYTLRSVRNDLPADPGGSASVTIDTDTVRGASPYIFNCSLRSVWGLNGMHADGSKASGFRSMVVAQYTAVSLQKDDRAFVKYRPTTRSYTGIPIEKVYGSALSSGASSTNSDTVYHLDSDAVYRRGWETTHIKCSNDSIIQVVSVFAIGFNKHFDAQSGGDQSITNSNSNFGQFSLNAEGFKKEAFTKDNYGYITSLITPKAITTDEQNVDWISIDVGLTTAVGISSHLYLFGFNSLDNVPPGLIQGYRVGAKVNDVLYLTLPNGVEKDARILMTNNTVGSGLTYIDGFDTGLKEYRIDRTTVAPSYDTMYTGTHHEIQTGEKILLLSDVGDLPENITPNNIYYAIRVGTGNYVSGLKVATSFTNAVNGVGIKMYGGSSLKVLSRVSDKESGDLGSPIQYDSNRSNWFVHVEPNNTLYQSLWELGVAGFDEPRTDVTYIKRFPDNRSLDERLYKVRIAIPKECPNARNPSEGFVIQESSKTGQINDSDFNLTEITANNFDYNRNTRFISTCSADSTTVTVIAERPHNLKQGDRILVKNVKSSTNLTGIGLTGFNGDFLVSSVINNKTFTYSRTDNNNIYHNVGIFSGTTTRDIYLPRFERNDLQSNFYIYRVETISPYIFNAQDGIYHAYVLKSDVSVPDHFNDYKYNQNVVDLYPQQDRDNIDDNPSSSYSFAKASPLGEVITNDLKKSVSRECMDTLIQDFGKGFRITNISATSSGICTLTFNIEHGLHSIVGYDTLTAGSGLPNGTYYNVRLLNSNTSWNGATAKVIISSGSVSSLQIMDGGSGYASGQVLDLEGFSGASITISEKSISIIKNNSIQITGIGTARDNLLRVYDAPSKNQIAVARTVGDSNIVVGQYALNVGPSTSTSSIQYSSITGIATFTFQNGHGLVAGNRFRILNDSFSTSNNLGDYLVSDVVGVNTFTAVTNRSFPGQIRILKHGFNSNDLTSDSGSENLGSRGLNFYANEFASLNEDIITDTSELSSFAITVKNSGISTTTRFELGSYIQIDSEILRVSSSTLTGSGNNKITAIRGYFGTAKENHYAGAIIKKISPIPIEIRRPSILRASGHTFEYLGYGPGNYSTGLPQIQVKTLSEREDFLAQSQERSGGSALYTGMNSDGDFFIGNTKYSSSSGEQLTFDIPIPTITGQDPSRLSVVFDEAIIKERILVEGGKSKQILSQFDGPVTFNENIIINNRQTKMNGELILSNILKLNNITESTSTTTGSVIARGGFGIAKNVNIGGNVSISGTATFNGQVQFNAGLVPDSIEDAYIGSAERPWASGWFGGIGISTEGVPGGTEIEDRTINAWTGDLILKTQNTSSNVIVDDHLNVNQALTVNGQTNLVGITTVVTGLLPDEDEGAYIGSTTKSFAEAHIDELRLGYSSGGEIDTRSGNLTLDSDNGTVVVDDHLDVNLTLNVDGATFLTGITTVKSNLLPETTTTTTNSTLGSTTKKFAAAYIDEIQVGHSGSSTIDTASGDLVIDSNTGQIRIASNLDVDLTLNVDATSYFVGVTTVVTHLLPSSTTTTSNGTLGSTTKRFSAAYVDELRFGHTSSVTIDTNSGDLILDAATNQTQIQSNLIVTGSTVEFDGNVTIDGALDVNSGSTIKNIRLGVLDDNTIDTDSTQLKIVSGLNEVYIYDALKVKDSAEFESNLTVNVNSNFKGNVILGDSSSDNITVNGVLSINEGATIKDITIGVSANNKISTNSGNLILDSTGGTVNVTDNLDVDGTLNVDGQSDFRSDVILHSNILPNTSLGSQIGSTTKPFAEAVIGKIRIADGANDNRITTYDSQDLILDSDSNIIRVQSTSFGIDAQTFAFNTVIIQADNQRLSIRRFDGTERAYILTSSGDIYTAGNLTVNGTTTVSALAVTGSLSITNTTQSTNTTTGALTVSGGLGVSKNLHVGGTLNLTGAATLSSTLSVSGQITATSGLVGNVTGNVTGNASTASKIFMNDSGNAGTYKVVLVSDATGNQSIYKDSGLTYSADSNNLSVSGALSVVGDITAFASDDRIKTNIKLIDNALDKVLRLSGFTFNFNEIGESLGYSTKTTHVGVSAQQVKSVLPEAVVQAPANKEYMTVKYEKIVPLLIEAIKELTNKVENLEQKLSDK